MTTAINPLVFATEKLDKDGMFIRRLDFKLGYYHISGTSNSDNAVITVHTFNDLGILIPSHYNITTSSVCRLDQRTFWTELNHSFGEEDAKDYDQIGRLLTRV